MNVFSKLLALFGKKLSPQTIQSLTDEAEKLAQQASLKLAQARRLAEAHGLNTDVAIKALTNEIARLSAEAQDVLAHNAEVKQIENAIGNAFASLTGRLKK